MSHLSVFGIFWKSFPRFSNLNELLIGEQEKEFIISMRMEEKNLSLVITVFHHSASGVIPIGDPWDGLFYPTLTLMIDSYKTGDRRVDSSRFTTVITQQASRCQLVILGTDFSIPTSHS